MGGLLYLGIGLIALTIGFTTGLSASPVGSVLIPLLFSLISAGGGFFVLKNLKSLREDKALPHLGGQLVVFSFGFLLGLWLGSGAKLQPEKFWPLDDRLRPAYTEVKSFDFRVTAAMMALDRRLGASGVGFEDRQRIIKELQEALEARRDSETKNLADSDEDAVKAILGLPESSDWIFASPMALADPPSGGARAYL